MAELFTTLTWEDDYHRFVFTHPHEIADDLCGIEIETEKDDPKNWDKMFGSPLALDLEDVDGLIKILTMMKELIGAQSS